MSLQNNYLQSHDQFKNSYIYSKQTFNSQSTLENKSLVPFTPALILRNTEYMTHLQNYLTINRPYSQVDYEHLHEGIDPAALCKIIVQDIYLLQICYLFKIKVYLSVNLFTDKGNYTPSTPNLTVFQLYCFDDEITQKIERSKIKLAILDNRFIKVFDDEAKRLEDFFLVLDLMSKHIGQYLNCIEKSRKQQRTNSDVDQNKKILSQFLKTYENIILVQKYRISEPKLLIKFLQQTKLFRAHSILVKIINNTLFYSIKLFSRELLDQLNFCLSQIRKFCIYESKEAKFEKQVVKIIDNFFTKLCMLNVIEITKSLKGMNEEQQETNKDLLSLFDYDPLTVTPHPTITATILVPEQKCLMMGPELFKHVIENISLQNFETEKQMPPSKNLEIQISYTYITNEIQIKCITDIDVLVDNMDYLNYLITTFNECMKSTLVIDTIEKFRRSMTKKIDKVIALRLMYKCKFSDEPLTKILELIDVGILASKIFVVELSKKSYIKLQDYEKRSKVCQIFRHYENIFRNLIRKFYNSLKTEH